MRKLVTYKTVFALFAVTFAALALTASEGGVCAASASHTTPYEYCYETRVDITNTGTSDLTDVPVRVLFPASGLIASEKMDPRGWDLLPVLGDLSNEVALQQQSLTSSQAPYWFVIPDLPAGSTRSVALYSANAEVRRDNGIYFTGNEYLTVSDHADFDITDDLQINVSILNESGTARDEIIVEHRTQSPGEGYRVQFEDFTGLNLTFEVDGSVCRLAWDSAWTGTRQVFSFRYLAAAGPDTFIDRNGVNAASCDIDEGAIATTSNDLMIGTRASTLDLDLSDAQLHDVEILAAGVVAGHWGFDPRRTAETNSTNPYLGTTDDYSGNSHTANYTFNRSQVDYSFSVGTTQLVTLTPNIDSDEGTNNVVGLAVPDDFSTGRTKQTSGIVYSMFVSPLESVATATGAPEGAVIAATFSVISLILAAIVWRFTGGYMPAAVLTLGIGPSMAVAMGYVEYWWLFIWGLTVAVVWLAQLRSQQSS